MRNILNALETTPTPCAKAQDAYISHCAAMAKDAKETCGKLAAYNKLNPGCDADCLAGHLNRLEPLNQAIANQNRIIDNPKKSPKQKAAAQKVIDQKNFAKQAYFKKIDAGPKIKKALDELAARRTNRLELIKTKGELNQAVKSVQPKGSCKVPNDIDTNPACETTTKRPNA
jgi:hypothetical protein